MIKYLNEEKLEDLINDGVVLVDFYADWCGPCKMLSPILESISEDRTNVKIIKVNVDEAHNISKLYGIMSIPTLIHFKNGKLISKKVGLCSKDEIVEMINE